jgi:hypothetical protein
MASSVRRSRSWLGKAIVNCPLILGARKRLTPQAQRPSPRDATIATATLSPRSLERMVRPLSAHCFSRQRR